MLNKALRLLQFQALHRGDAMRVAAQTVVPRQLNFPLQAFDELQAIKRRHGLGKNADALACALFLSTAVDGAAELSLCSSNATEVPRE